MVVLGDELEIDGAHGAVTVLDFEPHVREDEAVAVDVKALRLGDGQPGVRSGTPFDRSLVQRPKRLGLQFVVQDHALDTAPLLVEIGLDLAHHPEQARVVPDLGGLDPAAVIHLSGVVLGIAVVVEQRLALPA